jgi:Asp/Glu/hydantoin racemase
MTYGFMPGPEQPDTKVSIGAEQRIQGCAIGIVLLDLWYPVVPGNVANASTFDFPVMYKILKGTTVSRIFGADPAILELLLEAGKQLEEQGVRAIIGACGFFGNFQKEAAARLNVPVYLSSLLQIPIVRRGLKPSQKVGVITASAASLTPKLLSQNGVDDLSDIVITGAQDLSEFQQILKTAGSFNSKKIEQQLVGLAKQFVSGNPDIGAILLECSDMPPYAWAIQNAVRLPVFDFITLINWVHSAMVRCPFAGFM